MGILNLIIACASEATFACFSEGGITAPQCNSQSSTGFDLAITLVICVTVCISLSILAKYIKDIVFEINSSKVKEMSNTGNQEPKDECRIKTRDRYEAAWRFVNMCWKIQHPEPIKDKDGNPVFLKNMPELTPDDKNRYEEAWSVVREYIGVKPIEQEEESNETTIQP